MGFDERVMVLATDVETWSALSKAKKSIAHEYGDWLQLVNSDEDSKALSKRLRTTVAHCSLETTTDTISIAAYVNGKLAREVGYSAEGPRGQRWTQRGHVLPFEAAGDLSTWLAKSSVSATPDGYELFFDFLGIPAHARTVDTKAWRDTHYPIPSGNDDKSDGRPGPTAVTKYLQNRSDPGKLSF